MNVEGGAETLNYFGFVMNTMLWNSLSLILVTDRPNAQILIL